MSIKPPSVEFALRQEWSTKEDIVRYNVPRNESRKMFLVPANPSTGTVFSAVSCSTNASSKSSNTYTVGSTYSLNWPGLEGFYVDELEVSLSALGRSTAAKSTFGYSWQIKDDDATTWQNMTTFKALKGTTLTWTTMTVAHTNVNTGTGYNKLPLSLRLRFYSKSAKGQMKIKGTSYVSLRPKKQA